MIGAYKIWHEFLPHVRRDARYTLGIKIDASLIDAAGEIYRAVFANKDDRLSYLEQAARHLDLAKFFLEILWEIKAVDGKKYIALSEKLFEIGKQIGGWARQVAKETPASR